jgi:hypothetical protein
MIANSASPGSSVEAFVIFGYLLVALIPAVIASDKGDFRPWCFWWPYAVLLFPIALIHSLRLKPAAKTSTEAQVDLNDSPTSEPAA